MKNKALLVAGLALATLSTSAFAGNGFVRVEAGRSRISTDVGGSSGSDHDNAWSFRGGYWFNPNIAVEGFYSSIYDKSFNDGVDHGNVKLSGLGVGVVGKTNFAGNGTGFFLDGRAGIARGKVSVDGTFGNGSDTSTKAYYGVGLGYDFNPNIGLSLNFDRMRAGGGGVDVTADTATIGAEYRF